MGVYRRCNSLDGSGVPAPSEQARLLRIA
jgi:hypothetical protein